MNPRHSTPSPPKPRPLWSDIVELLVLQRPCRKVGLLLCITTTERSDSPTSLRSPSMRRHFSFALLGLALCLGVAWWAAQPREPDPFYQYDARNLPAAGTLLRQEPFEPSTLPPDTTGFRILYTTTQARWHGGRRQRCRRCANSAEAHPLIAYAHGTTGVRPGCAPSNFTDPFPLVPGFSALFQQGWAYVGTDYVGLGTSGTHSYMVGRAVAQATLEFHPCGPRHSRHEHRCRNRALGPLPRRPFCTLGGRACAALCARTRYPGRCRRFSGLGLARLANSQILTSWARSPLPIFSTPMTGPIPAWILGPKSIGPTAG